MCVIRTWPKNTFCYVKKNAQIDVSAKKCAAGILSLSLRQVSTIILFYLYVPTIFLHASTISTLQGQADHKVNIFKLFLLCCRVCGGFAEYHKTILDVKIRLASFLVSGATYFATVSFLCKLVTQCQLVTRLYFVHMLNITFSLLKIDVADSLIAVLSGGKKKKNPIPQPGNEPRTPWLSFECSTNWATGNPYFSS